ncbi:immune inhibitor A peptidase M6 family protein, partial [Vibrio parahaemolyticus V-223/04]
DFKQLLGLKLVFVFLTLPAVRMAAVSPLSKRASQTNRLG